MADDGYWKREQTAMGRLINNVINTALDAKDWLMTAFGMEPAAEFSVGKPHNRPHGERTA